MKVRESGMPERGLWESFFTPEAALDALRLAHGAGRAVEFGCGYGTFTLAAARRVEKLYTLEIEPELLSLARLRADEAGFDNIEFLQRNFIAAGTGLADEYLDYAMLFNILHGDDPLRLLQEVWRVLKPGALLGIMHWNYDPETPRGPPLAVRPRPEQCCCWAQQAGFVADGDVLDLPPYHYGWVLRK